MATPHTTGVAALYLQGNPGASPATVRDGPLRQHDEGRRQVVEDGEQPPALHELLGTSAEGLLPQALPRSVPCA